MPTVRIEDQAPMSETAWRRAAERVAQRSKSWSAKKIWRCLMCVAECDSLDALLCGGELAYTLKTQIVKGDK